MFILIPLLIREKIDSYIREYHLNDWKKQVKQINLEYAIRSSYAGNVLYLYDDRIQNWRPYNHIKLIIQS